MKTGFLRSAIVLGLITAVGPFAIDMYLPALPSIGQTLSASPAAVQMSLMVFFVIMGACQLVYGPFTDIFGRKLPIYLGLVIFALASVGCAFAPNVEVLIACRAVQAFGACAGMVVPRAIIRDMHTGPDATRLMSLLMLVVSISPILAPLTGSLIIPFAGWRGVFWAITATSVVALILAITQLEETHPPERRSESSWSGSFAAYGRLLVDLPFMGLTMVGSLTLSGFFIYLANSSFVLIEHYHLTPTGFSLCFGVNAASFFGFSQLTGKAAERFGLPMVIRVAVTGFAILMTSLAALMFAGVDSLVVMMAFLFLGYGCLGLVIPGTAVLSLEEHGAIAGTASALMGALQLMIGAAVMAVAGLFASPSPKPMVASIAVCAVAALVIDRFSTRRR